MIATDAGLTFLFGADIIGIFQSVFLCDAMAIHGAAAYSAENFAGKQIFFTRTEFSSHSFIFRFLILYHIKIFFADDCWDSVFDADAFGAWLAVTVALAVGLLDNLIKRIYADIFFIAQQVKNTVFGKILAVVCFVAVGFERMANFRIAVAGKIHVKNHAYALGFALIDDIAFILDAVTKRRTAAVKLSLVSVFV